MHTLYILFSRMADKYYVGETSDMARRFAEHRSGTYKGSYTTRAKDWEIVLELHFDDVTKARRAESFIKRMNSCVFIKKLLDDPRWLVEIHP